MNKDLFFNGEKFISAKRAAEETGYAPDHVAALARDSKVLAKRVGRTWYVSEKSILAYKKGQPVNVPRHLELTLTSEAGSQTNSKDLYFNGEKFISSVDAAKLVGYAPDHVAALARKGLVSGKMMGRTWYVSRTGILAHKRGKRTITYKKAARPVVKREVAPVPVAAPKLLVAEIAQIPAPKPIEIITTAQTVAALPIVREEVKPIGPTVFESFFNQAVIAVVSVFVIGLSGTYILGASAPEMNAAFNTRLADVGTASVLGSFLDRLAGRPIARTTTATPVVGQGPANESSITAILDGLPATVPAPLVVEKLKADLRAEIDAYAKSRLATEVKASLVSTQAPITIAFNQTVFKTEVLQAANAHTSAQSESDVDLLSKGLSSLKTNGTFVNPTIVGGSLSGVQLSGTFSGSASLTDLAFGNASGTNATTTNFFAEMASSTNLFTAYFAAGDAAIGTAVIGNSTTTNATTTSLFAANASSTNLYATNGTVDALNFGNAVGSAATTTNLFSHVGIFDDVYVNNYQQNNGTFTINSSVATGDIFSVIDAALTNGTLIHQSLTANAGNGEISKGQIIDLLDNTTAGGGYSALTVNVTGSGIGSGVKTLLDLNPGANKEIVFDSTGALRPTTDVSQNTTSIGTPSFYFKNGYFDTITANNISGTVVTGSTAATTWTVGSTQTGDVNEAIVFQRNSGSGNALLSWNASSGTLNDQRFLSVNYPFNATYTVSDASIATSTSLYSGLLTNNTTSGTQKLLSLTNTGTGTTENGIYVNNTGTGLNAIEIAGTWAKGIVTNNNSVDIGTGGLTFGNATGTNATTTNFFATNATLGNLNLANLVFQNATGTSLFATTASTTNLFATVASINGSAFNVTSGGNVGIGITNPSSKLTVAGGDIAVTGSTNGITFANNQSIRDGGASGDLTIFTPTTGGAINLNTTNGNIVLNPGTMSVGIGTSTPKGLLQLARDVSALPTSSVYGQLELTLTSNPTSRLSAGYSSTFDAGFLQAISGSVNKSLLLNPQGGSVGIGITNPFSAAKLHVAGEAFVSTSDFASGSVGTGIAITPGSSTGNTYGAIQVGNAGYTAVAALSLNPSGGNVGIGITNPSEKLVVSGNMIVTGNSTTTNATTTNFFATKAVIGSNTNQTNLTVNGEIAINNNSQTWKIGQTGVNRFQIVAPTAAGGFTALTDFTDYTDATVPVLTFGGGLVGTAIRHFWAINPTSGTTNYSSDFVVKSFGNTHVTSVANSSDVLTQWVNSDGAAYFAGNVGIGITNPSSQFSVGSGAGASNYGAPTAQTPVAQFTKTSGQADIGVAVNDGTNNPRIALFADNATGVYGLSGTFSTGGQAMVFRNAGSEYMRITSAGLVGIGTTTPSAALAVQIPNSTTNGVVINGSSNTNYSLTINNGGGIAQGLAINAGNTGSDAKLLAINNALGTTNFFTVTDGNSYFQNGNLGVGTTTPATKLDVLGGGNGEVAHFAVSGTGYLFLGNVAGASGYGRIGYYDPSNSGWRNIAINEGGGNVGIGTTNATSQLTLSNTDAKIGLLTVTTGVGGNPKLTSTGTSVLVVHGQMGTNIGADTNLNGTHTVTISNGLNKTSIVGFYNNAGGEVARITDSGNLGIGTTNPQTPLDVKVSSGTGLYNDSALRVGDGSSATAPRSVLLGVNTSGNGYGYLQSVYQGAGTYTALALNPKGGEVFVNAGADGGSATSTQTALVSGGDVVIKGAQGSNTQLGRLGFTVSGPYGTGIGAKFPAYIAGYADNGVWSSGIGLTFNTTSGADVSGVNGTERMRITSTGNVGIGTTNPNSLGASEATVLSIINPTNNSLASSSAVLEFGFQNSVRQRVGAIRLLEENTNSDNGKFVFTLPNGSLTTTDALTILGSNGSVGIGTTNPTLGKLQVSGNISVDSGNFLKLYNSANSANSGLGTGSSNELQIFGGGGGVQFKNSTLSSNLVTIQDGGNVGIGTTNPTSRLTITDSAATPYVAQTGTLLDLKVNAANGDDTTSRAGIRLGNNSNAFMMWYGGTSDRLRFVDGGSTEVLSLKNGGNVGIGTTNPVVKLETWGPSGLPANSGTSQTAISRLAQSGNSVVLDMGVNATSPFGGWLQSTSRIDLSQTYPFTLQPNGGNVGIGITNPGAKFVVSEGVSNVTTRITDRALQFTRASDGAVINTITSDPTNQNLTILARSNLYLGTNGGTSLTIVDGAGGAGNIGIGTTNPGNYKLQVIGAMYASGTFTSYTPDGLFGATALPSVITTPSSNQIRFGYADNGAGSYVPKIGFYQTTAGTVTGAQNSIGNDVNGDFVIGVGSSNTERMRITSGGNVGIGLTNPGSYKLDVRAASGVDGVAMFEGNATNGGYVTFNDANAGTVRGFVGYGSTLFSGAPDNAYFGIRTQGALAFGRSGVIDMFINTSGNVGIGTTNPATKLEIDGAVNNGMTYKSTDITTAPGITTGLTSALFGEANFLNSYSGYGITGTLTDTTVSSGIRSLTAPASDSGTRPLIVLEGSSHTTNGFSGITSVSSRPILSVNNFSNQLMTVLANGNVGIGVTNPGSILDVQAAAAILKLTSTTGTNSVYTDMTNAGGHFYIGKDSSTSGSFGGTAYAATLYSTGAYPMEFWTNSSRQMVITSGGSVGIGTTNPVSGSKLNVVTGNNTSLLVADIVGAGGDCETYNTCVRVSGAVHSQIKAEGRGGSGYTAGFTRLLYDPSNATGWSRIQASSDFEINTNVNSSTVRALTINTSGNVGIGTTNPNFKLTVAGEISGANTVLSTGAVPADLGSCFSNGLASTIALGSGVAVGDVYFNSTRGQHRVISTVTTCNDGGSGRTQIQWANTITGNTAGDSYTLYTNTSDIGDTSSGFVRKLYAVQIFSGTASFASSFDLAENYPTFDASLAPGEVVAVNPALQDYVQRSSGMAGDLVLGVISTDPAITLGSSKVGTWKSVALSGRVPVKISDENGAVRAGDFLAPASVPGKVAKAVKAGLVLGQALGDEQGGQVSMFVNRFFYDPAAATTTASTTSERVASLEIKVSALESLLSATSSALTLDATSSEAVASSFFAEASLALRQGIQALGQVSVIHNAVYAVAGIFDKIFAKSVHTDLICVTDTNGETCVNRSQLDSMLAASGQSGTISGVAPVTNSNTDTASSTASTDTASSTPAADTASSTPATETTSTPDTNAQTSTQTTDGGSSATSTDTVASASDTTSVTP